MRRRRPIDDRQEFAVQRGWLVRTVRTATGGTYRHRCPLEAYKAVCRFIEEHAAEGVTSGTLWRELPEVPCSQSAIALAFLKERGCVAVAYRRCYPASAFLFEDALVEFHALAEKGD